MYFDFITLILPLILSILHKSNAENCSRKCPAVNDDKLLCVFFQHSKEYKLFPSECNLIAYKECNEIHFLNSNSTEKIITTFQDKELLVISFISPMRFCIKHEIKFRRFYGESCPVFCPDHYRPVCGASKLRDYAYRSFKNGCWMDMLNCRGEDEYMGYVEVPLSFCQRHAMRNIFKEKLVVSGNQDYSDIL